MAIGRGRNYNAILVSTNAVKTKDGTAYCNPVVIGNGKMRFVNGKL